MTTGSTVRDAAPGPNGKYTVCRYRFPEGQIVEFTHGPSCIQPAAAWIQAHKKAAQGAVVDSYESDVPVNRNSYLEESLG